MSNVRLAFEEIKFFTSKLKNLIEFVDTLEAYESFENRIKETKETFEKLQNDKILLLASLEETKQIIQTNKKVAEDIIKKAQDQGLHLLNEAAKGVRELREVGESELNSVTLKVDAMLSKQQTLGEKMKKEEMEYQKKIEQAETKLKTLEDKMAQIKEMLK
jgi:hypothetical protein